MKKYLATNGVKLSYGLVRLDEDQSRARADNVNPSDNRTLMLEATNESGVFAINGNIEFRAGEKFEWTGDASRMIDRIQCLDVVIEEAAEVAQDELIEITDLPDDFLPEVATETESKSDTEVAEDELAEIIKATNGGEPKIELEQETDGSEVPVKDKEAKAPKSKQKKSKGKSKK